VRSRIGPVAADRDRARGLGSLLTALLGSALRVFLPPFVTDLGATFGLDNTEAAQPALCVDGGG
jgi:branched-chain amino acid transport system permease protein